MLQEKEKSLSSKLLEEKAKKIVRMIEKGDTKKAMSLLDGMNEKLSDNPEIFGNNILYIVERISDDKIKMFLLKKIFRKEDILIKKRQNKILFEAYEQSLKIHHQNRDMLFSYGNVLYESGQYEKAIEQYKQILDFQSDDYESWHNYGMNLVRLKRYEEAIEKYEKALKIKPNNYITLNSYGTVLHQLEQYETATAKFEQALNIKPDDYETLHNYALSLEALKRYEEAIEKYGKILNKNPNNYKTLHCYGVALLKLGRYEEAIEKFEKALSLKEKENESLTLAYYGCCLYMLGQYQISIEKLEKSLQLEKNDVALFFYAFCLAALEKLDEAIDVLSKIKNPYPQYSRFFDQLSLHLPAKEYFQVFNPRKNSAELRDNEMLNRAIYHKIKNEISILKDIIYEIISDYQDSDITFRAIIDNINHIFKEIEQRRNKEKQQIKEFPSDDYEKIIKIISDTAHNISDFVNNELAIIEADVRDLLSELNADNPLCKILQELLTQIKITQGGLNDLKAINEGIKINQSGFYVRELFENWEKTQKLQHASISLDIQNGESLFYGDKQKIKGFLNELIENAIKYNPDKKDLQIRLWSRDETNPSPMFPDDIVGRYLLIGCSDNGKGILPDKKKTIFLPLETTSDTGSGLGLFIIKRTLKEMNGYIQETGEHGANFEIYIPYNKGETQ